MSKKILLIKGSSQYDAVRYFCDEMLLCFTKVGCLVTMFDMTQINPSIVGPDLFDSYDMVFSFNAIGIEIYNSMKVHPFFWTFLVDPPFHVHKRLELIDKNDPVMVSCIDRNHVAYIDRYYKNIAYTCFMPHGGITGEPVRYIPYPERSYDVILMGSLSDWTDTKNILNAAVESWPELIGPIVNSAQFDIDRELDDIVLKRAEQLSISLDSSLLTEIMFILEQLDALRRYNKRLSLVRALCKNNISIDIWGSGWKEAVSEYDFYGNLRLHDPVSYNTAKKIMADARIIISDMPLFHDGSHERVFSAMQSGAVTVSDRSIYLEECFVDEHDIIYYDLNNIEKLASRIRTLLSDFSMAENIIRNADMLAKYHTWQSRANAIIAITSNLPQ